MPEIFDKQQDRMLLRLETKEAFALLVQPHSKAKAVRHPVKEKGRKDRQGQREAGGFLTKKDPDQPT